MPTTRTALTKDISQENREDHPVVQHLQRQVANAMVLYANYKQTDEFAERVRMIGQDVKSVQLQQMQEAASVHSAAARRSIREMIEEADTNLLVVIKEMRDAARAADESNDPGTVDLFSRIVQIHEKHEWFLREILKKKDGVET